MSGTILFPFAGNTVGGSHISTALIIQSLDKATFKPVIVLEQDAELQKNLLREHGLNFEIRPEFFIPQSLKNLLLNLPRFLKSLVGARAFLKKNKIDLVHCDDGPARYLWFYASILAGVPYVHVQRTPLHLTLEKRVSFRFMRAVAANSRMTMGTLPPLGSHTIQAVIPPLLERKANARSKNEDRDYCLSLFEATPKDCVLVGFLANMQPRKRPETFIRIASLLNEQQPGRFCFVMAGAFYEDYEARLKAQVQAAGLGSSLVFTGFVNSPERLLNGFDILIAPAVGEAFGRVLVEAMALETPVIAARDGGHCEIIRDAETGFLCTPDDVQGFAARVVEIADNQALRGKIAHAALTDISQYDAYTVTKKFETIYSDILDLKRI